MSMSSAKVKQNIAAILGLPGNGQCADCHVPISKETGWASLNLGVVICINCGGVHRSIGTHVSKVRSFRLDTNAWTDQIVAEFTQIGGNDKANAEVWEANLPVFWMNPRTERIDELRDFFIRAKYERRSFLPIGNDPTRYNPAIIKMPTEIFQGPLEFKPPNARKWTKMEWGIIHTRWFSRYHSPKDRQATQFLNMTELEIRTGLSDQNDRFEFAFHHVSDTEEKAGDGELVLEARCDDFKTYVKWVHHLRITAGFYRCYDQLYATPDFPPPLNLSPFDIQADTTRILGYAKSGGVVKKSKWYCALNGYLYVYRENVATKVTNLPPASNAMDLQLIDAVVDVEGERSGAKFAVIIHEGDKCHVLKFDSGPAAVKFYSDFKSTWRETRGRFTVDFSQNPPIITGENSRDRAASFSPRGFQGFNFEGPPVDVEPQAEPVNVLTLIDELKARLPDTIQAIDEVKSPEEAMRAWNQSQYGTGAPLNIPSSLPNLPPEANVGEPGAAAAPAVSYQQPGAATQPPAVPPPVPGAYGGYGIDVGGGAGGYGDAGDGLYNQNVDIYSDNYVIGQETARSPQDHTLPTASGAAKRESLIPSYIRFIRYFRLTDEQQRLLNDPGMQSQILSYIGDQATMVAQGGTLKITIHSGIPLPRREDLWTHIIDSVVQIIGGVNEIKQ